MASVQYDVEDNLFPKCQVLRSLSVAQHGTLKRPPTSLYPGDALEGAQVFVTVSHVEADDVVRQLGPT